MEFVDIAHQERVKTIIANRAGWRCECDGTCGTHAGRCERRHGDTTIETTPMVTTDYTLKQVTRIRRTLLVVTEEPEPAALCGDCLEKLPTNRMADTTK